MTKFVRCELCPHECVIPPGKSGDCRVRVNIDGKLIATVYGRAASVHVDPMEKKPLYHFLPGRPIFSISTLSNKILWIYKYIVSLISVVTSTNDLMV